MSVDVSTACWRVTGISGTAKCVLMALADHANDAGICWPSVARLVELTCFSERAVQSALKTLVDAKVIVRSASRGTRTTEYRLTPADAAPVVRTNAANAPVQQARQNTQEPHPADSAPVQEARQRVQQQRLTPADSAPGTVKNHHEPSGNKRRPPKATTAAGRPDDVPEDVWKDFLAHRSKQRAIVTDRVVQEFRAEAESIGWTLAQAMLKSMQRGWRGFEAGWIKPGDLPPGAARQIKVVSGLSAAGERAVQSATAWLAESASNTAQTVEAA